MFEIPIGFQVLITVAVIVAVILVTKDFKKPHQTRNRSPLFSGQEIAAASDADERFYLNKANELSMQYRASAERLMKAQPDSLGVREYQLLSIYLLIRSRILRGKQDIILRVATFINQVLTLSLGRDYYTVKRSLPEVLTSLFRIIYIHSLADTSTTQFKRVILLIKEDLAIYQKKAKKYQSQLAKLEEALNDFIQDRVALSSDVIAELNFLLPHFGDFVLLAMNKEPTIFTREQGRILIHHGKASAVVEIIFRRVKYYLQSWFCMLFLKPKKGFDELEPLTMSFVEQEINRSDKSGKRLDLLLEFDEFCRSLEPLGKID